MGEKEKPTEADSKPQAKSAKEVMLKGALAAAGENITVNREKLIEALQS